MPLTRRQEGQVAAEYVGMLFLVGLVIFALAGSGPALGSAVGRTIDALLPGGATTAPGHPQTVGDPAHDAWHEGLYAAGPHGSLLSDLDTPDAADFNALVKRGDIYLDGGKTNRRYFHVKPHPGDGVIVQEFFIPSCDTWGLHGDCRSEKGENPLRSGLPLTRSRVTVVIDRETGRGVITQSETCTSHLRTCNEPRPIALNGDKGPWTRTSGIDFTETNQINIHAGDDGVHIDYDVLNSITPLAISVDGSEDFTRGSDGFMHPKHFKVDRYPQIQVWQYLPDGREREISRNDYQGGHFPVQGALPHCDLPDLPNLPKLPTVHIPGTNVDIPGPDLPNLPNLPSVPCPRSGP